MIVLTEEERVPLGPAFAVLKERIVSATGHFYYDDKDSLLWQRVKRRMQALKLRSLEAYVAYLDAPVLGAKEWGELEAEITIGETFFFRYPEQFAVLRDTVLPGILRDNQEKKRIRIWSAGCANGAEAYSVAILLYELLGAALADWRITIMGTDISARAVETAQAARFTAWSLRAVTPEERQRYFVPQDKGQWLLRPVYRSLARFQQQNLVTLLTNTPLQFTGFDLILCRNVLIYFHPETAIRLANALSGSLAEGGWLFFGHAEASLVLGAALKPLALAGTTVYRRGSAPDDTPPPPLVWREPEPVHAPWQPLTLPEAPHIPAHWQAEPAAPAGQEAGEEDSIRDIRARADVGDFEGALALCRAAAHRNALSPRLHFYEGVLLHAVGALAEAESAFRRALYLNKQYPIAHYHLGLALSDAGKSGATKRAIANAVAAASGLDDDMPLEDGDGMTARDLKRMARQHIGRMESAP